MLRSELTLLKNNYIQYIDGLRAIAVSIVFIFHLSPEFLPGGFIGVDVFFVLSGYLISGIIIERNKTENFYRNFIEGRVRRLVPAYVCVVAITTVCAWFILLPNELITYVKSLLAATTFTSNIFFFLNSGYFAGNSEFFPLLHTWSLSVEWQFYLIFPLVLIFMLRIAGKYLLVSLFCLFVVTAALVFIATKHDPSLAFYNTPFRASEFLVGTIVYILLRDHSNLTPDHTAYVNVIGWLSITTIVIASFWLNKAKLFPGVYATLIACITGAILVVGGVSGPSVSWKRALSLKPIVYLGNISYSFYLWHWPLITFYKLYLQKEFEKVDYFLITIVTLILSDLTWRFIECKFRTNKLGNTKGGRRTFVFACVLSGFFLASTLFTNGFSDRFSQQQLQILNVQRWADFPGECYATQQRDRYFHCKIGTLDSAPKLLIFGDSHAQVLVWSLHKSLQEKGMSAIIIAKGGCPPFMPGVPTTTNIEKDICENVQKIAFDIAVKEKGQFETILLAGRWVGYENAALYGRDFTTDEYIVENFEYRLLQSLNTFIDLGYRLILIDSVPEPGFPVPEWLVRAQILGEELEDFDYQGHSVTSYLNNMQVDVIRPSEILCTDSKCKLTENLNVLYFDSNHLSVVGADLLVDSLSN